jgi:hypothetical protein
VSDAFQLFRWTHPAAPARVIRNARLIDGQRADVVAGARVATGWNDDVPQEQTSVVYDAMSQAGLLDDLVRLRIAPEPISSFASRWGFLIDGDCLVAEKVGGKIVYLQCERLNVWDSEVGRIRDAFELWAAIEARDIATLRERISVNSGDATYHGTAGDYSFARAPLSLEPRIISTSIGGLIKQGDLVRIGRVLVTALVNARLRDLVVLRLVAGEHSGPLVLRQMPESLLGLAWLRLAEAASGDRIPRLCPRCKSWFMIAAATRRGHGTYCSPKCRISFHARRQQARALAAEGASVRSIAARLQVTTAIVREWIVETKTTRRKTRRSRKGA